MAIDKITNDVQNYTNIQGLVQLHAQAKRDPNAAKKEVAKQFESIFIQMVLRSMREANKPLASDLMGSSNMDFYQEMFDKQLSMSLSNRGIGLAQMIEANLNEHESGRPIPASDINLMPKPSSLPLVVNNPVNIAAAASAAPQPTPRETSKTNFTTAADFVKSVWGSAKRAASSLGVSPAVLVAQAALETDWGKKVIHQNLFNIKADSRWKNQVTTVAALENKNGVLVKEKSNYRAYNSVDESFDDYADFIKTNQRYGVALTQAHNPEGYMNALQSAGYATDNDYAKKVMQIHDSAHFKTLLVGLK